MSATYKILNGSTFKVLSVSKVGITLKLTANDGREKTFYHEIESTDPDVIKEEINKLAWDFDQNAPINLAPPILEFNKDTIVTDPNLP